MLLIGDFYADRNLQINSLVNLSGRNKAVIELVHEIAN